MAVAVAVVMGKWKLEGWKSGTRNLPEARKKAGERRKEKEERRHDSETAPVKVV